MLIVLVRSCETQAQLCTIVHPRSQGYRRTQNIDRRFPARDAFFVPRYETSPSFSDDCSPPVCVVVAGLLERPVSPTHRTPLCKPSIAPPHPPLVVQQYCSHPPAGVSLFLSIIGGRYTNKSFGSLLSSGVQWDLDRCYHPGRAQYHNIHLPSLWCCEVTCSRSRSLCSIV